jgi:hypothetical protein
MLNSAQQNGKKKANASVFPFTEKYGKFYKRNVGETDIEFELSIKRHVQFQKLKFIERPFLKKVTNWDKKIVAAH